MGQSPTVWKMPARYIVEAVGGERVDDARVLVPSRTRGFQAVAAPAPPAANAATPPRGTPPLTVVNAPPAYSVEPEWASA